MQVCLVLLCGLPAAGKTTLVEALKAHPTLQHTTTIVHLCFDQLWAAHQQQSTFHFSPHEWKESQQEMFNKTRTILHDLSKAQTNTNQTIVIVDDNLYYKSMRHDYEHLARKFEIGCCIIWLECSVTACLQRNQARQASLPIPVPDSVILDMAAKMEIPSIEDYNSTTITKPSLLIVDTEKIHVATYTNQIIHSIQHALQYPLIDHIKLHEQQAEKSRHENDTSLIYQADLALRKKVSQLLSTTNDKQKLAPILNIKRRQLLDAFKKQPTSTIQELEKELEKTVMQV